MLVNRYLEALKSFNKVYIDLVSDGYELDFDAFVHWLICHGFPIDKYAEFALTEMDRTGYFKE